MTKEEAAAILENLLNGINPVTGEVLPEDHVCAETAVIRALHMGYAALMHGKTEKVEESGREAFIPASRENTHRIWTDEEDQYLRDAWSAGVTVDDMRRKLKRTLRSVKCRLVFLGVADYTILERRYQPPKGCEHSGLPWYQEEEDAVRALYGAGIHPGEIARNLRRTLRAVALHMLSMGLISEAQKDALLAQVQEGGTPS